MPDHFDSHSWLKSYFQSIPHEIDVDVISEYISVILEEADASESSLCTEIESLLSAYLTDDVSKKCSSEIVRHFIRHRDQCSVTSVEQSTSDVDPAARDTGDGDLLLKMEEQMRALMQADYEKQLKEAETRALEHRNTRDACTTAVLRDAGVAGYQGDSETENDVEIAITNAAFQAKQLMDAGGSSTLAVSPELHGASESTEDAAESDLDLQDLADKSGYGNRDSIKPGTVEDALSVLNPSLFGSSGAKQAFPPGAVRLPTPGPRPMGFRLSGATPTAAVSIPSRVENSRVASEEDPSVLASSQRKKKQPASKHIAKVGALAEAKGKADSKRTASAVHTAVRARQEEMASFLFSDSDEHEDPGSLPEGGKNRELVIATERKNREAAAQSYAQRRAEEKMNREQQLTQQAKRKQAAQQKAQKVERRR
ncbi:hypothetical protein CLF_103204 [Clonorchis sinensis]|uniref:CCDC43 PWI-like domain-containing protein n=1 Tax=Clonorchis sinensis TaxID=79923 RepID=G7Y995_CLOSI|nr:hypothetical protein CLF_103204 [Clonorchis sinensis]